MSRILYILIFSLFAVQASAQVCSFSVSNLDFGTVDTLSSASRDGTATVSINCPTSLLTLSVCPSIGYGTGGGSGTTRFLLGPSGARLAYELYSDPARTQRIGSLHQAGLGPVTPWVLSGGLLTPIRATETIYGRIPPGQGTVPAGTYMSAQTVIFDNALVSLLNCNLSLLTGQATAGLQILARVSANCAVTATDLSFGTTGVINRNIDATSTIGMTCTPGTSYTISLGSADNTAFDPARRTMRANGRTVQYGLYQDTSRTVPWGTKGNGSALSGVGTGLRQTIQVYGRVPPQTTPPSGAYLDTVVVTVEYGS